MTVNEKLGNINTTRQHQVELYKKGVSIKLLALFKKLEKDLNNALLSFPLNKWTLANKSFLLKELEVIRSEGISKINSVLLKDLKGLNKEEATFYIDQLENVLDDADIKGIDVNRPDTEELWNKTRKGNIIFDDGQFFTLTSFLNTFNDRNQLYLKQAVNKGYKQKLDVMALSALLFGVGGLFLRSRGQIDAWSATTLQYSSSFGRDLAYKANANILNGYNWNSVLDSKTTDICRHNAGKYWLYGRGDLSTLDYEQYPPLHFRCRSSTSAIVKSYEELGIAPDENVKSNLNGDIPATGSYNAWLVTQPTSIQKQALGPVRYGLWESGEVSIDSFYTMDGRTLSLKELQRAGVEFPSEFLQYVH